MSDNPRVIALWRELNVLAETDATAAAIVAAYRDREEIALVGPRMLALLTGYRALHENERACYQTSRLDARCEHCRDTDAFLAALPAILATL